MTVRLLFARPLPGTVGETQRVTHLFAVPPESDSTPQELTALCGTAFGHGELELLDGVRGMPCESCMVRSPGPGLGVAIRS
ncbi:hypothetical protein [Amycolatopsis aidingensis]|uniref:hypothetical protein n=1 Tax=Amycolatopsis aidingensis TaxID=2842453 RepID=UPI001C0D21CE|nr:hypothetical protein [Amycolatopsis aidingensis]